MLKLLQEKIYSFLIRLGGKVGLNLPYFVKNGLWVSFRYFIIAISGFAVSVAFARLGTKELLGQYQFIIVFMSTVSIFSLLGLNTAALKSVTRGQEGGVIKAVRLSFLTSLLGSPIIILYGAYQIFQGNDNMFGAALVFAGILFPFFYAPNTWSVFYEGKLLFRASSVRIAAINIAVATGLFAGLYMKVNVLYLILIYLITNLLLHWIFFFGVVKKIQDKSKSFLDKKYGLYVSGQKFVSGLSNNIPPLAISFLFGFDSLAVYYITYYAIGTIAGFLNSLSALYMPLLFKKMRLNYKRIILQNILIGISFLVIFVIFVKFFFILLYGEEYKESVQLAYFISLLLILMPLRIFLINYFTAKKRNGFIIVVFIFANVFAFLIFYATKNTGFITSVSVYLYGLQLSIILPLLTYYFLIASKNIDSMRSEIKS